METFLFCLLPLLFGVFAFFCLIKAKWRVADPATGATIRRNFLRLVKDQRGQDMIEYVLMAGFVAIIVAALFIPLAETEFWNKAKEIFEKISIIFKIVFGVIVLAVFLGIIIWRRRYNKSTQD